jgi:queuine tRNA-ribosyltransferase
MGVGRRANIIEAVCAASRFLRLRDAVPQRPHGHLFTWDGVINLNNRRYDRTTADRPGVRLPVLPPLLQSLHPPSLKAQEPLALRLQVMHNLYFLVHLMERIRAELDAGTFAAFRGAYSERLSRRI